MKGWLRKIEAKSIQVTCHGKREGPPTDGHAVDGSSSRVDEKHPRLEKRTTYTVAVPYDHLLICTGSGYAAPIKAPASLLSSVPPHPSPPRRAGNGWESEERPETDRDTSKQAAEEGGGKGGGEGGGEDESTREGRLSVLKRQARAVAAAKHVLIVGGGSVGVELAAELAAAPPGAFPPSLAPSPSTSATKEGTEGTEEGGGGREGGRAGGKEGREVVLVSKSSRLLPGFPPACAEAALRWLRVRREGGREGGRKGGPGEGEDERVDVFFRALIPESYIYHMYIYHIIM
jgi:hypothetical protein